MAVAFSRIDTNVPKAYGTRRETRSTAPHWAGPWSKAEQVLHGREEWQAYALVPFRLPSWRPGLYMGLAAFFNTTDGPAYDPPKGGGGKVTCELVSSGDYVRLLSSVPVPLLVHGLVLLLLVLLAQILMVVAGTQLLVTGPVVPESQGEWAE